MPLTPTHRKTHEWVLLAFAVAIVWALCWPFWQWLSSLPADQDLTGWTRTVQIWGKRLMVPEQIACYGCFTWAVLILLSRYVEVRRQRKAFKYGLLPTEEGVRILPEDARPLQRKI